MSVTDSEFHMWRAIFAISHADHVVSAEERRFMIKALNTNKFSPEQRAVLESDMEAPQDIATMFARIEEQKDRSRFFYFARMLLWCDGDFAAQEQKLLTELGKAHHKTVDFSKMVDTVKMEFEDSHEDWLREDMKAAPAHKGGIFERFLDRFTGK